MNQVAAAAADVLLGSFLQGLGGASARQSAAARQSSAASAAAAAARQSPPLSDARPMCRGSVYELAWWRHGSAVQVVHDRLQWR
mmetsp:Transcript_56482/g.183536  ORF Transcript_56482/g.183536 Transcript_56482/m.183536 type:complete len:84 (+) Transcript_56482:167-418(+)